MPKFSDNFVDGKWKHESFEADFAPTPRCCSDRRNLCKKCKRKADLMLARNAEGLELDEEEFVASAFQRALAAEGITANELDDDDEEDEEDDGEYEGVEDEQDDDQDEDEDDEVEEDEEAESIQNLVLQARDALRDAEELAAEVESEAVQNQLLPAMEFDYAAWAAEDDLPTNNMARTDDDGLWELPQFPAHSGRPSTFLNNLAVNSGRVPQDHLIAPDAFDYAEAFARQ